MKKLIFTLLISFFALNVVAQEENASPRYELIYQDNEGYKLDTQTGKMWLLTLNNENNNSTSRKQYTINTQILSTANNQSKPGRYTFARAIGFGGPYMRLILDTLTGNIYYLYKGSSYNTWKLVPF